MPFAAVPNHILDQNAVVLKGGRLHSQRRTSPLSKADVSTQARDNRLILVMGYG